MKFRLTQDFAVASCESFTLATDSDINLPYDKFAAQLKSSLNSADSQTLAKILDDVMDSDQWWEYMTPARLQQEEQFVGKVCKAYGDVLVNAGKIFSKIDSNASNVKQVAAELNQFLGANFVKLTIADTPLVVPKGLVDTLQADKTRIEKELNYSFNESTPAKTGFKKDVSSLIKLIQYTENITKLTDKVMYAFVASCGGASKIDFVWKKLGGKISNNERWSPAQLVAMKVDVVSSKLSSHVLDMYDQVERFLSSLAIVDSLVYHMCKILRKASKEK